MPCPIPFHELAISWPWGHHGTVLTTSEMRTRGDDAHESRRRLTRDPCARQNYAYESAGERRPFYAFENSRRPIEICGARRLGSRKRSGGVRAGRMADSDADRRHDRCPQSTGVRSPGRAGGRRLTANAIMNWSAVQLCHCHRVGKISREEERLKTRQDANRRLILRRRIWTGQWWFWGRCPEVG